MNYRRRGGILLIGLLVAMATEFGLSGCRSDETDAARRGLSTAALRANRVPAQVIGEPQDSNEVEAGADRGSKRFAADAGFPLATPFRDRERLSGDTLALRDTSGVVLDAEWRWSEVPSASNAAETSMEALETLRNGTRLRMRIEVAAAGRLSIVFVGNGYPWPDGTELRARIDRFGHVLVWPGGKRYRIVVPGALRSLFADRRLDRGLLFTPKVAIGPAGSVGGQATVRQNLTTPLGEVQLEQANVTAAGIGAPLLCRLLIELLGADPNIVVCAPDQLPLRASLASAPGGKLQFIVNQLSRKQDLTLLGIQVPPDDAILETSGVPVPSLGTVPRAQLAALRSHAPNGVSAAKDAPPQGLLAINRTLSLRALMIDGVPVAWLASGVELAIPELKSGTYSFAWRDFFGTLLEPAKNVTLPAKITLGKVVESGG